MWIKFWTKSSCASGLNSTDEKYEWFDKRPHDEYCKSLAEEMAECTPYWHSERGCTYGFDRVKRLPAKARHDMIKSYKNRIKSARLMLKILEK